MKIIKDNSFSVPNASLILGFFDGVHLGHRKVIQSAVNFARQNNTKTVLLTFKDSPSGYFGKNTEYIFSREYSYKLIADFGVNYLVEADFTSVANITAADYLANLAEKFSPLSVSTGFNYSFGANRIGTPEFLENNQKKYGYKYLCTPQCGMDGKIISSTYIKSLLKNGDTESASKLLESPFILEGEVIKGAQLGRKIGFPTANINYQEKIVKIPYGVWMGHLKSSGDKQSFRPVILNWGIKPTVSGKEPVLEVHIPNFDGNLYGEILQIEIVKKIRDEKMFNNIEELKNQIAKDVRLCLEL